MTQDIRSEGPPDQRPPEPSGANRRLHQAAKAALATRGSPKGGAAIVLKDILVVLHWAGWYVLCLYVGQAHAALPALLAIPMALSLVAVMFGVMHDGSHRSISAHAFWNRLGSWTLIVGGASAISWRQEHVVRHHSQTNTLDEDPDLESGGWLRFHPVQAWRPIHRWQHIYAAPLYCLVALRWIWFEDLDDLIHNRFAMSPVARLRHAAEILLAKVFHLLLFLIIPAQFWGLATVATFYLVHIAVVGLVMSLTFVLAHIGGDQDMYVDAAARPEDWALTQLATTADFAIGNRPLGWFLGGLNFQVEHHLFPGTSPKHYPSLQPVVKAWAQEQGLPYHVFPTVRAAMAAHFRHLAALASPTAAVTPTG